MNTNTNAHAALVEALRRLNHECADLFTLATDQIVNDGEHWTCKSCSMELDSGGGHRDDCCASRILDIGIALHTSEAALAQAEGGAL
jgi:hypothetical protein